MTSIKQRLRAPYHRLTDSLSRNLSSPIATEQEVDRLRAEVARRAPDDLVLAGHKVYSQNDEDGIIAAIFERIGGGATFLEIGVENGRECNTHLLLLKGWRGSWIDGSAAMISAIADDLGGQMFPGRFAAIEAMVDDHNIVSLYRTTADFVGAADLDFFSLDIDGNDMVVLDRLLASGARPKVLCLEYNGKFPPPLAISVAYDPQRGWGQDDYFGASLQALDDVATAHGYRIVTCNITGANAFYVRDDLAQHFPVVTVRDVWRRLRLELCPLPAGHVPTLKFLADRLASSTTHAEATP